MSSDIIIIDEPFIWIASIKNPNRVIELTKVTTEQHFLIGKDPKRMVDYFHQINEEEVRKVDQLTKNTPFTRFGTMDLLLITLN